MSEAIRIVQLGDWHLGGRAWPGCFALDAKQQKIRQSELRASVQNFAGIVAEQKADAVLLPGDLFDRESVGQDLVELVVEALAQMPPVYITPGNHDHYSAGSAYSDLQRRQRNLKAWPENVHIFNTGEFTTCYLPGNSHVAITGRAFVSNSPCTEHLLANRIPRDPAEISILLLHGSRTQFAFEESQKITLPFTSSELLSQNFSYTALGHYHRFSEISDGAGNLRAMYGGRAFAAEMIDDCRGCVCATITPEGAKEVERYSLDERRVFDLRVECDNVSTPEQLRKMLDASVASCGATKDDLLRAVFCGTHHPSVTIDMGGYAPEVFAFAADFGRLRAGYDIPGLIEAAGESGASAQSLLCRELCSLLEHEDTQEQQFIIQDALELGMQALQGLPLTPKDVD